MPNYYIAALQEFKDKNGMSFLRFKIRNRNKKKILHSLMYNGIQIVCGGILTAYAQKLDARPIWLCGFSAMVIEGAFHIYKDIRKCIRKMPRLHKERVGSTMLLLSGTITYSASIAAFSRALKENCLWIPYLGGAAIGYYISVWSNNRLGRTILNRRPFFKCYQLLFGQTLIWGAAYYLMILQNHDEEWLAWLPYVVSGIAASTISAAGHRRVESNNEPRWLLFKGLELIVGGSILCINSSVLFAHVVNNQFHPFFALYFIGVIFNGVSDIISSLESFQGCVEMEEPVFYCICSMIAGPIVFFSAFLSIAFVNHPIMLSVFIVMTGTGFTLMGKSILRLYELVPTRVFSRYCWRVLGPVATVYGTLTSSYTCYRMGWPYSVTMMPLIPIGIYTTYRGWKA